MANAKERIREIAEKIVENRKADLSNREFNPTYLVGDLIDVIKEKKFKRFQENQHFTDEDMEEVEFGETFDDFSQNYETFNALTYLSEDVMTNIFRNANYAFENYDGIVELLCAMARYLNEYAESVL